MRVFPEPTILIIATSLLYEHYNSRVFKVMVAELHAYLIVSGDWL